jgi:hypothetical protein
VDSLRVYQQDVTCDYVTLRLRLANNTVNLRQGGRIWIRGQVIGSTSRQRLYNLVIDDGGGREELRCAALPVGIQA